MKKPEIIILGESTLFVRISEEISEAVNDRVNSMVRSLESLSINGIEEIIPSYSGFTLIFNPFLIQTAKIEEIISTSENHAEAETTVISLTIPVLYGGVFGPDIHTVASHNNITSESVIALHTEGVYRVYMLGFTPGFPYLGGLSSKLHTPRRSEPRLSISAGSVGIAGAQTGIYPLNSPGGWQIIGRTPLKLFDPQSRDPFLLNPGMELRFESIHENQFSAIEKEVAMGNYTPLLNRTAP